MKNNIKKLVLLTIILTIISIMIITFMGRTYTVVYDINDSNYKLLVEDKTDKIEILEKKKLIINI